MCLIQDRKNDIVIKLVVFPTTFLGNTLNSEIDVKPFFSLRFELVYMCLTLGTTRKSRTRMPSSISTILISFLLRPPK